MLLLLLTEKMGFFFFVFNHVISFLYFRERQQGIQEQETDRSVKLIKQFKEILS